MSIERPATAAQCERDIIAESSQIARNSREDAEQSLRGLQQLLEQLTFVDGPKSLIMISEGLAIDGNQRPAAPRSPGRRRPHVDQRACRWT